METSPRLRPVKSAAQERLTWPANADSGSGSASGASKTQAFLQD